MSRKVEKNSTYPKSAPLHYNLKHTQKTIEYGRTLTLKLEKKYKWVDCETYSL